MYFLKAHIKRILKAWENRASKHRGHAEFYFKIEQVNTNVAKESCERE